MAVISVAFSSSGRLFAAGGAQGHVHVFDATSGEAVGRFDSAAGLNVILLVEQRPGECVLLVGSFNGFIYIFPKMTAAPVTLKGLSLDGETFKRGGWSMPSTKTAEKVGFGAEVGAVHAMAVSRDGTRVVAGGRTGEVIKYALSIPDGDPGLPAHGTAELAGTQRRSSGDSPTTLTPLLHVRIGSGSVSALALNADASILATGGDSKLVELWYMGESGADAGPPEPISDGEDHSKTKLRRQRTRSYMPQAQAATTVMSQVRAAVGRRFSTKGDTKRPKFGKTPKDLPNGSAVGRFACETQIHALALNDAASTLAVGCSTHAEVYRLSWKNQAKANERDSTDSGVSTKNLATTSRRRKATINPGRLFHPAYGRNSLSVGRERADDDEWVMQHEPLLYLEEAAAQQGGVALSSTGQTLAVGGKQLVHVYHVDSGATVRRIHCDGRIRCVSLSSDGSVCAHGGFDESVTMLRIDYGTRLLRMGQQAKSDARAVHVVAGGSLMAVGTDEGAIGGTVRLYDAFETRGSSSTSLRHMWSHDKAVWAVRLSTDESMLFAAGYDGVATLYDPVSKARILSVGHFSARGPAFIWSLTLSHDMKTLAVACWSGKAHIYRLNLPRIRWRRAVERLRQSSGLPPLAGGGKLISWGRLMTQVNSILKKNKAKKEGGLERGASMASNIASLLSNREVSRLSGSEVTIREDPPRIASMFTEAAVIERSDRVYCIDMTASGSHVVVGGRDKLVSLYEVDVEADGDASTADVACKWTAVSGDFVYTVALSQSMSYVVYGGPEMVAVVCDGRFGARLWSIPCSGTVWSVAILQDLVSPKLVVGGDFSEVSVFDLSNRTAELRLPVSDPVYDLCITGDAVAYSSGAHAYLYGQAGSHYGWRDQPDFSHITRTLTSLTSDEQRLGYCQMLLEAHPAAINAHAPGSGVTLLQELVHKGWGDHSVLLKRLIQTSKICRIGLRADASGKDPIAVALGMGKLHPLRVMLKAVAHPRHILASPACMQCVSRALDKLASRYPAVFLEFIKELPLQAEPEVLEDESSVSVTHDVYLPKRVSMGSDASCPKGIWRHVLLEAHRRAESQHEQTSHELRAGSLFFSAEQSGDAHAYSNLNTLAGIHAARLDAAPIGYPRVVKGGLQAVRVPIENFAGHLVCSGGTRTTLLELIVDAVSVTHDYSVYSTRSMNILLDFKWEGYARRRFTRQLFFFLLHLVWTTYFTIEASAKLDDSLAPENITFAKHPSLLLGWCQTTFVSLIYLRACYRRAQVAGLSRYVQDGQEMQNFLYNALQVLVNILFWMRQYTPAFVFAPGFYNYTAMEELGWTSLRDKEEADKERETGTPGELGLYLTLQSLVMLMLYMRILFFFRGFRSFGSLMNIVQQTVWTALPFLVLLSVVTLGFGLSTHLLLQHTVFGQDPNYAHPMETVNTIWNAGLRFIPPKAEPFRSRTQIIIFYVTFMVFVQGILVNLLVAMMAGTFAKLRASAQLVSMHECAKLVLQLEPTVKARAKLSSEMGLPTSGDASKQHVSRSSSRARTSDQSRKTGFARAQTSTLFGEEVAEVAQRARRVVSPITRLWEYVHEKAGGGALTAQHFPRWLHVLLPATNDEDDDESEVSEAAQQKAREEQLQSKLDKLEKLLEAMALQADDGDGQSGAGGTRRRRASQR